MTNRIRKIVTTYMRLDPAQSEVWLSVYPERLTSATQVRGRLVGPRCPYAGTVEVAYPLREQSREYEATGIPRVTLRVVIPEASFWDPESPFLYQGPVELWEGDALCERVSVSYGLRVASLGPRGLRWNGRPLTLRGVARARVPSEAEARTLHAAGVNALLAPVTGETAGLWDAADRFGFLVLGRVTAAADLSRAHDLSPHTGCLGWVLGADLVGDARVVAALSVFPGNERTLRGVELRRPPSGPLPEGLSFVLGPEALLPELADAGLPLVVLRENPAGPPDPAVAPPGTLGWVDAGPPPDGR